MRMNGWCNGLGQDTARRKAYIKGIWDGLRTSVINLNKSKHKPILRTW